MTRLNLYTAWFAVLISAVCYWKTSHDPHAAYFVEALDTIHRKGLKEMDRQTLFDAAINGMAHAHDQHSAFIPRKQRQRYLNKLDQHLKGIGVEVAMDPDKKEIVVANTVIGSPHPAYDAGMRSGDRIVAIEGESVVGMPLIDAIARIGGPMGEQVAITVVHENESDPVTLHVTRSEISIDSVRGDVRKSDFQWDYQLSHDRRIAYIRLTDFGDRTSDELSTALADLQKEGEAKAIIIDVRDNSGGYLTASTTVSDFFIDGGVIVTTLKRGEEVEERYEATAEKAIRDLPMAVLVNSESASASEIFAACMQDYDRAVVVGDRTFGKGSVQQMIPMERNRSILKLTTARYVRPSGRNIDRVTATVDGDWGVLPNEGFVVKLNKEQETFRLQRRKARDAFQMVREPAEDADPIEIDAQLQRAVEYLQSELDAR